MNRERTKGPEDWVYKKKKRLGSDSRKPLSWPSLTWSARTWGWKVESHCRPFCLVFVWCWNSSPALLIGGHTCTTFSGRMLDSRSRQFFTLGTCTCTLFTVDPVEKPNTDLFRISKGQAPHELTGNYMLYSYYIHFPPAYTADCKTVHFYFLRVLYIQFCRFCHFDILNVCVNCMWINLIPFNDCMLYTRVWSTNFILIDMWVVPSFCALTNNNAVNIHYVVSPNCKAFPYIGLKSFS